MATLANSRRFFCRLSRQYYAGIQLSFCKLQSTVIDKNNVEKSVIATDFGTSESLDPIKKVAANEDLKASSITDDGSASAAAEEEIVRPRYRVPLKYPADYRLRFPEFLPYPEMSFRHHIREKLERMDMLRRRAALHIPEFYVGSIMAVTVSDLNAPNKQSRFLGICIQRGGDGLRAFFILRNVIDNIGIEIMYEMYNPTIQKVEVIRLEKRLDDELIYLRDALPEYSTFPFDMEIEYLRPGSSIPVNDIKVKLKPRPWFERWERREDLVGFQELELPERFYIRAQEVAKPWGKYDLMRKYREEVPLEDQAVIFEEVYEQEQKLEKIRHPKKNIGRKR